MKKIKFSFVLFLLFVLATACQDELESFDDCFDCPDTPLPTGDPNPGPNPGPDPSPTKTPEELEYDRGYFIGKLDAKMIAQETFYKHDCLIDKGELKDYIKTSSGYLSPTQLTYNPIDSDCYYTTPSQKAVFYEFVQEYLDLTAEQVESYNGTLRGHYWLGIWEGFSFGNCYYSFQYAYTAGCDLDYN